MRTTLLVLLTLTAAVFALPSAASTPVRSELATIDRVEPLEVRAEDGTALRGHVYLPEGDGPFATVLEFSPYWGTTYPRSGEAAVAAEDGRQTLHKWLAPFADAGFAVALVNVRGTDLSGGCMQWGTRVDGRDGATVVDALADMPWSNGSVGMIGHSYPAWMAYATLAEQPPALDALAIASGIIDPWNLMTRNGAPFVLGPPAMPAATAGLATGALALGGPAGAATMMDTSFEHVACPRYAIDALAGAEPSVGGDRNAYWDAVDLRPRLAGTDVPVLVANGMQQEGHMLQVEGLWDLLGGERRMVLGQWNHQWPDTAGLDTWPPAMVAWFDEHLRGADETVQDGIVDYQVEGGAWRQSTAWPPDSEPALLALDGGLILPPGAPAQGLSTADRDCMLFPTAAQCFTGTDEDLAAANCSDRQAIFVSPPLAEDVTLAGNFDVTLTAASTLPDGNVSVVLFSTEDVSPCPGPSAPSASPLAGYLKMEGEVRRALGDLRHVRSDYGVDFPVGTPVTFTMTSHPLATHIAAGERLVLAVGGGARELFPDVRKPQLSLFTGPGQASLQLPVVEGQLTFASAGGG